MDERTIYAFGTIFVVSIAFLSAFYGKGNGGRSWAIAWTSLVVSGASRTFVDASPLLVPAYTVFGSIFSLLLLHGSWRFSRGDARLPRAATVALLLAIPLRILAHPHLSELANRALGSALCTVCVVLSCALLLDSRSRRVSPSARALGFAFPTIIAVSWVDGMAPWLGIANQTGIALWFADGVAIAAVKLSAFLSRQREAAAALHAELANHLRAIVENSTDLVAEIDESGTILYANRAHRTVLGLDPAEVVGLPRTAIAISPSADELAEAGIELDPDEDMIFVAHNRDDGRAVTLECSFHRVRGASGEMRTVIISRDITERAAKERHREELNTRLEALVESRTEELGESLRQLQEANRLASLGTMAAGIAHQINNPIGSIQMGAEFALATPEDAPDQRDAWRRALENAIEQAQRCGRIVSSMLQFARNEPTKRSHEDLAAIVRRSCDTTEAYAEARNARIETRGLDLSLPVHASAIELEQAFLNLIRNACESSNQPHVVVVTARNDGEIATVTIYDDGRGIPQETIDRVLDPFFTTRLEAGGTGLGLSVAHGVISDHDGQLTVESTPSKGTTVTVTLPLESDATRD
ncbi:MAG: ATP-binding protein [bacterium]|nr:ATP-binding protein [bacterium]